MYRCQNIKDFTLISVLETLENLDVSFTNISDISFLGKNKNIKELNLEGCVNIKDFAPISKLERLEYLDIGHTNISDISFLKKNKNIKELNLLGCKNIGENDKIFKNRDIIIFYNFHLYPIENKIK